MLPSQFDVQAASVCVGVVLALTLPWLSRIDSAKSGITEEKFYQDEDGVASEKTALKAQASCTFVTRCLHVTTSIGLLSALFDATSLYLPATWALAPDWTGFSLWALVSLQAWSISLQTTIIQKYNQGKLGAVSAIAIVINCACRWFFSQDSWSPQLWLQIAVAVATCLSFLSFPKRPVVFFNGNAVVNENGASVIDWLLLSWGFLYQRATDVPEEISLEDVPAVGSSLRLNALRAKFSTTEESNGLWTRLLRVVSRPLVVQYTLVIVKATSEFGSRFALFKLLVSLENNTTRANEAALFAALIAFSLVVETISGNWLSWVTHAKLYLPLDALLQSLIYEKLTRKRAITDSTRNDGSKKENAPSTSDMVNNHSNSIATAVVDCYFFPMAALKIFLDLGYLIRLLGWRSILIGLAMPIILTPMSKALAKKHRALQAKQTTAQSSLSSIITEALQSLHRIRLSSLEKFWERRLLEARTHEQESIWATTLQLEVLNLVSNLGPVMLASVSISMHALDAGYLSPSVAFASLSLFGNLQGVFRELPQKAAQLHKSWTSCQKLQQFLQEPDQVLSSIPSKLMYLDSSSLSWYGEEDSPRFELNDVTLVFPRGKLSIITGKVGSGKSLLLAALLDEASTRSGRIGKPPAGSSSEKQTIISGSTAFVSQPPWIDDCSVRENIVFGYDFDKERYDQVLRACALDRDLDSLSNGDLTKAGAGGSSLSGGQKCRVALARALYSPAEILVLEDVLGAVDTPIARWICNNALKGELADGRTIILATHRPELCLHSASYVVTVQNGTAVGTVSPITEPVPDTASNELPTLSMPSASQEEKAKMAEPTKSATTTTLNSSKPVLRSKLQILWAYMQASGGLQVYILSAFVTVSYRVISAANSWWLTKWKSSREDQDAATAYNVGVYLFLCAGSAVALSIQSLVFVRIGQAASNSLFNQIVRGILTATLRWIDTTPFGQIVQSLDHDMHTIDRLTAPELNGILSTCIHILFIITTSAISAPNIIVPSVILLVLFLSLVPRTLSVSRKLRSLFAPTLFPISDHINSTALGLTTIRAFGKTKLYIDRMQELLDVHTKLFLHVHLSARWAHMRIGLLGAIFAAATAAAMAYNNVDAATAGFTITLALQVRMALSTITSQASSINHGLNSIERLLNLTDMPKEAADGTLIDQPWPSEGKIEVQDLTVRYDAALPAVLQQVSFDVKPRQRLGIVGRTGAGKSSLTSALLRFVEAAKGSILIDGKNISRVKLERLRRAITFIPQDAFLFSGTLRSNLDPNGDKSDAELLSALHRVHLADEVDSKLLADGVARNFSDVNMDIHTGGSNLSHGQRQLVCLARALLAQSRILILDEATSGIDTATDAAIQQVIRDEFAEATILVVAHKLMTVADFDAILVLSHGEVAQFGSPQELLGTQGMFLDMVSRSGDAEKIRSIIERCK